MRKILHLHRFPTCSPPTSQTETGTQTPVSVLPYNHPMFRTIHTHYIQPLRTFNGDARLFLWVTIINGIIFSGWQLFFNIYMLQSGFTREFLGVVNSLPNLTALLLGIAIGHFSDRIGRKQALIVGILFAGMTYLGQVLFKQPTLIVAMAALTGIFNMF